MHRCILFVFSPNLLESVKFYVSYESFILSISFIKDVILKFTLKVFVFTCICPNDVLVSHHCLGIFLLNGLALENKLSLRRFHREFGIIHDNLST